MNVNITDPPATGTSCEVQETFISTYSSYFPNNIFSAYLCITKHGILYVVELLDNYVPKTGMMTVHPVWLEEF
jgi:hypothetical protein